MSDQCVQQISICGNLCNPWQKTFELKAQKKIIAQHAFGVQYNCQITFSVEDNAGKSLFV